MKTEKSLKSISLTEMEAAFSKALTELAGRECTVTLNELRFETGTAHSLAGTERVAVSGIFATGRDSSEDEVPF